MTQYYKTVRSSDWNYGGQKWKLSRSKIDLFVECPRCFFVDNKLGVARPRGFPFNLNSAVDLLLKKEFDTHREAGTPHPYITSIGLDAVPFKHPNMNTWRENFEGIQVKHKPTGFTISGAVDDIWQDKKGDLIVVDYKATSKDEEVTLDSEWQDGYKRQMEVYQWLLRESGFKVSSTGYFVYANGLRDKDTFDNKLEFEVKIIPYTGNPDWIEGKLLEIKKTLESDVLPDYQIACDYCRYRKTAAEVSFKVTQNAKNKK